jgi:succinate dehydrogenase hydrophobic anchor subunit
MNNHQIRHMAQAINVTAFAQFGVFGYAGLKTQTMDWLAIGVSAVAFLILQLVAVYLLGFVSEVSP